MPSRLFLPWPLPGRYRRADPLFGGEPAGVGRARGVYPAPPPDRNSPLLQRMRAFPRPPRLRTAAAAAALAATLALAACRSAPNAGAAGAASPAAAAPARPRGTLFIVGGGPRPPEMMRQFVELAGGPGKARVLILAMASGVASAGD